jgi:tetratricopeptide (TPR) repeat protein
MSLVNDMLRDLDRRRQLPVQAHRVGRVIDIEDDAPRPRAMQLALLILVSLGTGLAGGYWLMERPDTKVPDLILSEPATVTTVPVQPPEPDPLPLPQESTLEVAEVLQNNSEFSLRLRGNQPLDYSITDRNNNGMTLKFDKLDAYDDRGTSITGLSVIQMPDYTLLELELPADADMKLYEAEAAEGFELVLSGRYREPLVPEVRESVATAERMDLPQETVSPVVIDLPPAQPQTDTRLADAGDELLNATLPEVMGLQSTPQTGIPETRRRALDSAEMPLRVARGFTLEQQDRSASQSAVALVQSGRLMEAYEKLLSFLAANPEAHVSRETLATILLAQQEHAQATLVIEEGLRLAPNYAPYKKIKARLLIQDRRPGEALRLLEQVAPTLQADKEYHELLATLYQQSGDHGKAIATYQQLLRTNSKEGRWWTGLGISLEAQGDTQKAIASYQAALQQSTLDPGVRQYSQGRIRTLSVQ